MEFSCEKCGEKNIVKNPELEIPKEKEEESEDCELSPEEYFFNMTISTLLDEEYSELLISDSGRCIDFLYECPKRVAYFWYWKNNNFLPIITK